MTDYISLVTDQVEHKDILASNVIFIIIVLTAQQPPHRKSMVHELLTGDRSVVLFTPGNVILTHPFKALHASSLIENDNGLLH